MGNTQASLSESETEMLIVGPIIFFKGRSKVIGDTKNKLVFTLNQKQQEEFLDNFQSETQCPITFMKNLIMINVGSGNIKKAKKQEWIQCEFHLLAGYPAISYLI